MILTITTDELDDEYEETMDFIDESAGPLGTYSFLDDTNGEYVCADSAEEALEMVKSTFGVNDTDSTVIGGRDLFYTIALPKGHRHSVPYGDPNKTFSIRVFDCSKVLKVNPDNLGVRGEQVVIEVPPIPNTPELHWNPLFYIDEFRRYGLIEGYAGLNSRALIDRTFTKGIFAISMIEEIQVERLCDTPECEENKPEPTTHTVIYTYVYETGEVSVVHPEIEGL